MREPETCQNKLLLMLLSKLGQSQVLQTAYLVEKYEDPSFTQEELPPRRSRPACEGNSNSAIMALITEKGPDELIRPDVRSPECGAEQDARVRETDTVRIGGGGSMRRSLQPTQVAQVVQLIQDGTSMRAVARRFAVSVSVVSRAWRRYQETGQYIRRRGGGRRRATTQQAGPLPPPLCKEEQEEHCQSPAK
ncbi:hypothetical protein L3Q82_000756 [Scortum barcoo]|uniref:Uncharacterized protein n=1 Tax=Scortum barcoo TaxID=214431 RepID=A0ACB8WDA1_9TELE|nr:hypothetical protein L3Q82_000756 [Scortum barcoo]